LWTRALERFFVSWLFHGSVLGTVNDIVDIVGM
jgi:hypothetical protein